MPKVTVIVPVYNVEKYLSRCLDSIMEQSFGDYQVICINDCSPDHSQDIIDEYERRYQGKLIALSNKQNIGLGKTRERGMRHAEGEYILFIDSDDYIQSDYIDTYVCIMEREQCDVVIGGYTRDIGGKFSVHKIPDSLWSVLTYPIACAKMFRKEFLMENQLEFSDIRSGEDIFFSLCLFSCGVNYRVIDYAGYYYYMNPKSITGTLNYERKFERFVSHIFDEYLNWFDIAKLTEEQYRMIEYTYIANMINALITYGHGGKIKCMRDKYDFFLEDLKKKFPDYKANPFFGLWKPRGQTGKIRFGVGVVMKLHKVHLDRLLFYLISLV